MSTRRDPRTGRWYFRVTVTAPDGRRKSLFGTPGKGVYADLSPNKKGAEKAEALAVTAFVEGRSLQAKPEPKPERKVSPTIKEYSETFLKCYKPADKPSAKLARKQLINGYVVKSLGSLRLDRVQQKHVDGLVSELLGRGLARKTVNNVTAALSSLLRYAARDREVPSLTTDEVKDLRFEIKTQDPATESVPAGDVDKLAAAACPRYRVAILLAADAGLRIGEVRALRWLDVDEIGREITISASLDRCNEQTETKGWKRRTVPISPRLWKALQAVDRSGLWVVPRLNGDQPLGYDATREALIAIYDRAKVEKPSKQWHALRHTFGTELARAGVPVHVIRELMGHESIETTLRYMHTDRAAKRDAIGALSRSNLQQTCSKASPEEKEPANLLD